MARTEKEYRKLPGRGFRKRSLLEVSRTLCTLWLGKDHLLLVDSLGGYSEDYKRFYYRDIQALIIRKTTGGRTTNLVLAGFAALFLLAGLPDMGVGWRAFWFFLAGLLLLFVLINSASGPTCVCHLRTAVQTEGLPSLNRLRTARKALRLLKPLIEEAQGRLAAEEVTAEVQQLVARIAEGGSTALSPAVGAAGRIPTPPPILTRYQSRAHALLFTLLLAEAARQAAHIFASHIALVVIEMLLVGAISITLVVALIKQQQTDLSASVRRVTWSVLGLTGFGLLAGYVNWIILALRKPGVVQNNWELMEAYAALSAFDLPWLMGVFVVNLVGSLLLGAAGLYCLQQYRQGRPQPPPLAPAGPPVSSNNA